MRIYLVGRWVLLTLTLEWSYTMRLKEKKNLGNLIKYVITIERKEERGNLPQAIVLLVIPSQPRRPARCLLR